MVDDKRIVELYFERDESAISETAQKYGRYCHSIAYHILNSDQDAEECVNDTYLRAWDAIPPHKPSRLSTFLGKITRNLALNRYAYDHAQKRGDGVAVAIDELADVLCDPESEEWGADDGVIGDAINGFLATLDEQTRRIFVRRYWYVSPIKEIARDMGLGESRVKVTLHRTRGKLKFYLESRGIMI